MREVKEAEYWLESAKKTMAPPGADREKYTVIAAQCIHSIIRANDALTLRYLNKRAMRHDEAITLISERGSKNRSS
ncbi:MAG: hypothetical protein D6733_06810 [Methanobacteriota archaeon]|nr:MAG: hypothetical protein D6733_06810 [Euryarchaeota archaeon]